jgi:hypothetical protein
MEVNNMEVYFEPDKKWWQFWKRDRYLKENQEFSVDNGTLNFKKPLKGQFYITYSYIKDE